MVIGNGYIRVYAESGGGYDSNGNPIAVTAELGEPIPCNWVDSSDGRSRGANYTIVIDLQSFPPCRFKLYDHMLGELGEFNVNERGIVPLAYVGNIQITVHKKSYTTI